ncbi:MAG: transcriptional repressor LexA [Chloroflexi bacterium]|nr:transcriptional repressor LexA [Chloroflexota bacterium]MXX84606.1 transcriptional repressor LexA [Chloroflexota bacterium]MYA93100.1 transcriptional repressor LexA [Chloroflexota bacterium]MYC55789.1 transcriptional repressor LexA [Chloroflexota bacterium]MYD39313.1 transcriptional repressor LexA [Chloroflexota bacterium]
MGKLEHLIEFYYSCILEVRIETRARRMKKFQQLSARQQRMLRFMTAFVRENGYPPSIREIGDECHIGSTSVVNYNLNKLVDAGFIERSGRVSRGLRIVRGIPDVETPTRLASSQPLQVALVGRIAAGEPISLPDDIAHHIDEDDYISVPPALLGNSDASEVFALMVRGDSMIDAMIQNGDIVILRRQNTADNGDMVAAWLKDDSETTLKHFYRRNNMIELQPANPAYQPLQVLPGNCEIKGKVLSVMRAYA